MPMPDHHLHAETGSYQQTGYAVELSFIHSADTWQTWPFLFAAALTIVFALVDALPLLDHGWLGRLALVVIKLVTVFLLGFVIMRNRRTRIYLLRLFKKIVRTEQC